ncbi:hypothetical protein QPK29_031855 [Massilia sp. YIM B02787]|uniref:Uncharacterized protein n=1 Tax=Massilia orientalis TaxID=3050128 RepID=A0ACC7MK89_9BURK|nr:hypothetical protein [Massilia sp. YIM B02787]
MRRTLVELVSFGALDPDHREQMAQQRCQVSRSMVAKAGDRDLLQHDAWHNVFRMLPGFGAFCLMEQAYPSLRTSSSFGRRDANQRKIR